MRRETSGAAFALYADGTRALLCTVPPPIAQMGMLLLLAGLVMLAHAGYSTIQCESVLSSAPGHAPAPAGSSPNFSVAEDAPRGTRTRLHVCRSCCVLVEPVAH